MCQEQGTPLALHLAEARSGCKQAILGYRLSADKSDTLNDTTQDQNQHTSTGTKDHMCTVNLYSVQG